MLFSRYGAGASEVLNFSIEDGSSLYFEAKKQKNEETLKMRWILHYQDKMSFEDLKEKAKKSYVPKQVETKSVKNILLDLRETFG